MTMTASRTIPFARPWIGEEERRAVLQVLEGHVLTHGPQCRDFEQEFSAFLGAGAHSVTVSSCMAALHLAYLHFGIGPGDEVIVPAQTHTATVHAVEWVGAKPVFVDCDPATGNLTAAAIAAAVTPRTKALSVVHFLGTPCDMPAIMRVAEKHQLRVIEDCAIALGSRYQGTHVGLFGDAGCFSFYPVKHITTGEGGMFVTKHAAVAQAVARLRAFGVDRTHTERSIPGMYDVPSLGLNYRMSELQAALGRVQLRRFPENLAQRRKHFAHWQAALRGLEGVRLLQGADPQAETSPYCLSIVLEGKRAVWRNGVVAGLNAAGVGTSIYYPQPVPRLSFYQKKYGYDEKRFPGAVQISDHSLALPVGPHLQPEDIEYAAESLKAVLTQRTKEAAAA